MLLADVFHKFNFFLNTIEGGLFLNATELVVLGIVSIMILLEYLRSKDFDLKYLLTAFAVLFAQKLFYVIILSYAIFGKTVLFFAANLAPIINEGAELVFLLLLTFAFILPTLKSKDQLKIRKKTGLILALTGALVIVLGMTWFTLRTLNPALIFRTTWINTIFVVLDLVIVIGSIVYLLNTKTKIHRKESIVAAFGFYLIILILESVNILFYGNTFSNLAVASAPFPLVSILMFTLVVYLRLVDKAKIYDQLAVSEKKYEEAREVSKLKDEFVSVASHELRTPLTGIKLYSNLLLEEKFGKINKEQKEAIKTIDEETTRLSNLVTEILDMSRLESGKSKLHLEEFNASEEIKNNPQYEVARQKGISVTINCPDKFIVLADKQKLRQVLENLMSNAIKFTDAGGNIIVTARMLPKKRWELSVSDTGKGIEKKKIPKLFNKFYQAEEYMTRGTSGTGLGLAIVKKIVDMHKAKIKVESQVGKGSKFSVVFVR